MTRNPRRPAGSRSPASLMLALEPRLMFDAAALSSAADTLSHADPAGEAAVAAVEAARASDSPAAAGTASDSAAAAGTATVATAAPAPTADTGTTAPALLAAIASDSPQTTAADAAVASAPAGQRHELAIIDTSLTDWQTLAAGLRDGIEVLTIDGSRDGFAQLADALAGRERGGLDAIHVFSHGSEGQWRLGSSALDVNTEAAHASELQAIAAALAADGDLLLYGCDTGAGSRGTAFLDRLASATGADVAASTDRSGSATAGGNWTLEAQRGAIETATAADAAKLADYNGTLATYTVTSTADSGAGSFRQAVLDANASGGTDTIVFDNSLDNQTITLTSGVISVTDSLIIDGDLDGDDTPDVVLDGGSISGNRALEFQTTTANGISLTVRSLEFAHFDSNAAGAGAAIHFYTNSGAPVTRGNLTISDSIFHNNTHISGALLNGGAVSVRGGTDFTIERSIFYSNTAGTNGGALYFNNGVIGTVRDSLFYDNQSNATTATTGGGAIGAFPSVGNGANGSVTLENLTVVDNRATNGGGGGGIMASPILAGSTVTIRNSLIVNNSASDVSTAASGTVNQVSNLTGAFSGFVNAAGRNYHLAAGATAAIDKGNNAFVSSSTDLDGTTRIKNGSVDYGAYEYGVTNSAPTVANALADQGATANQSFLYTFAVNSFSDADNDTLSYTATLAAGGSLPAWLNFNAATRTFSGTPANGDAGSFTVRVTATDPSSASVFDDFVVSVAAANVAPTLTNLAGDSLAYVEGTAASIVDQGTAATVSDPDSTDFAGGTLTVAITAGRDTSEDVLGIRHQGSGAGQIGVSGSTVSYGGVAIGSFTGGSGSNDLVVTLNGSATPAAVQALVRNITYVNSDTTSATAGTRTLGFTLSDGDGGTSSTASASVVVSARPISLTSPSSQWTVVLQGTKFDPNEDQQANAGPDIVGGSGIGTLYTLYDDAGTTAITDDTLAFRVRIDDAANNQNPPKYIGYLYFGLDVDLDGDIDVFLSAQGTSQGVNLDVYSSGGSANASPSTTSIGSRTAIASFNGTTDSNFLTVPTIDSGAPADFGSDGEPDYFLSFKVGFSALKTVIDTMPINNAGSAGSAIGTALSGGLLPTTAIQYVVATATNANTFNADVGGYGPADNYSLSYTAQGAFSPPLSFANLFPSITSDGGNATAAVSVAENTTTVTTVAASDANGDTITYSISGGADQAKFTINAATGALAFLSAPDFEVPTDTDHDNVYQVTVTASDGHGGTDTQQISVSVTNVADGGNSAPSVANAIADQNATEDQPFSFQFAGNTFADADVGDTLSYTATLANGNPLPTWLSFNAATRTFSGTPANGDVGAITVRVTATDSGSASISDDFVLTVANVNDAPIILGTVAAQVVNDNATLAPFAAVLVADIDNPAQTLTVTVTLDTALKGTLSHPGGGSYNPGTGIWSFSGSAAAATNALRALVFTPTANLAPPGTTVTTTFTIAVDDGVAAPVIDAVTTVVSTSVNDAPTLASPIADQNATEDQPFGFQVPDNTFAHVDVGDVLSYTATLASGNPLPAWLTFNAATRTFSGTPANADVGAITVRVTATDGSSAAISDDFVITVANVNDAPTLANSIPDQNATEDQPFSFQFASGTFADVDAGDVLTYSATLANGDPLPTWLTFNAATRTFSGTPANGDVGAITVRVTATDGSSAAISDDFVITVANVNDAPTLANSIPDQNATEDQPFSFQFASGTFADVDAGDVLTYSATLANGDPLPTWLTFDAATRTFSGTPANGDVGAITVRVTATDGSSAAISDDFVITVANVNDAPSVANSIPNQNATEDQSFSFQFAANTFADVDVGDTLTYTATLANGSPLPAWLSFNAATRTFSGTPPEGGPVTVRVTATDTGSLSASDDFVISVANINDSPVLSGTTPGLSIAEDAGIPTGAVGTLIGDFVGGISDPDPGALKGIAVVATDESHGTWYYTTDNGANWQAVGSVSNSNALLLADDGNTRLYFAPAANFNGTLTGALTFKAWDRTSGTNGDQTGSGSGSGTFSSSQTITIPGSSTSGPASPYPSTIAVSGLPGVVTDVSVTLNGMSHTFPDDIDIVLVGPQGQKVLLMSDVGGLPGINSVTLTFDDAAAVSLPDATQISSGTYRPTNIGAGDIFSNLSGPFASTLAAFDGTDPNGNWQLYATDDVGGDVGVLNGWSLSITTGSGFLSSSLSTASDSVTVTVTPVNDAPTLATPVVDQNATENQSFSFQFANNTFADIDAGDVLTYSASLANGDPLPSWLTFDAATRTFSGIPPEGGQLTVRITATDNGNASVSDDFVITVANVNDAPSLANNIPDQNATEDQPFSFQFASGTFADVDAGDTLTYSATLANGDPLPTWLTFNAATRTFSGTPANGDVGQITVRVTATDGSSAAISDDFVITVANVNDAPSVANNIPDQNATEDQPFSFQFAGNTFADVDAGDVLTYSATIANGDPLPTWLTFNAATRTFSGTPANGDVGQITVRVTATDGSSAAISDDFVITVANVNDAPSVANNIPDQNATEDQPFSFQFAGNTFADVDAGDVLTYSATLANGDPLPTWLTFNAATRTFSGTPANGDVGQITVRVTATDGSSAAISDDFVITVANVNDAPSLANSIPDQNATEDQPFSFQFASGTFADVDAGDTLTYSATLANGDPLPTWLTFNATTRTFSGTPANGDVGAITVRVTATDGSSAAVSDDFVITVANVNDAPSLANSIPDQSATEDQPFSFQFASGTFADVDAGDVLTYSATLANGDPLPTWLTFDAATRTFSGTPANGDVGAITVRVTATDGSSAAVSDDFVITVANVNDAPTLANSIPDQNATEDQPFSFQFASGTFADVDAGDVLTYSATLANGDPLPTWLTFNAATRTFSGTPANGDVGAITVRVTATDGSSAAISDDFVITVANVNDVPTLANSIPDQSATEDHPFSFQVPANTFADVDAGDTLTYSATLANGDPLPTWLTFNAATRTFSGTPANGDVGAITVRVTATDGSSAAISDDFVITVANVNDAPSLANSIPDQNATEDQPFSFQFAGNTFADVDAGDTLTYSATLANGDPLPTWLTFNAATRTFSGTPANGDVGAITVRVTATDGSSAAISSTFTLSVLNTNDAPVAANDAVTTDMETAIVINVLANDSDVDADDALRVTAVESPAHGTVRIEADGRIYYEPEFGFSGQDAFRYTVTDRNGATAIGTVQVTVLETRSPVPVNSTAPLSPTSAPAPTTFAPTSAVQPNLVLAAVTGDSGIGSDDAVRDAVYGNDTLMVRPPAPGVGFEQVRNTLQTYSNPIPPLSTPNAPPPLLIPGLRPDNGTGTGFERPALAPESLRAGSSFGFSLPPLTAGGTREVRLSTGEALPAWMNFDPATGRISGQVPDGVRGTIELRIRERDAGGAVTERVLQIEIDAPASEEAPPSADAAPLPAGLSAQLQQIGNRFDAGRTTLLARLAALG